MSSARWCCVKVILHIPVSKAGDDFCCQFAAWSIRHNRHACFHDHSSSSLNPFQKVVSASKSSNGQARSLACAPKQMSMRTAPAGMLAPRPAGRHSALQTLAGWMPLRLAGRSAQSRPFKRAAGKTSRKTKVQHRQVFRLGHLSCTRSVRASPAL